MNQILNVICMEVGHSDYSFIHSSYLNKNVFKFYLEIIHALAGSEIVHALAGSVSDYSNKQMSQCCESHEIFLLPCL